MGSGRRVIQIYRCLALPLLRSGVLTRGLVRLSPGKLGVTFEASALRIQKTFPADCTGGRLALGTPRTAYALHALHEADGDFFDAID